MRRFIEKEIEDKIATAIIDSFPEKITGIYLDAREDNIFASTI